MSGKSLLHINDKEHIVRLVPVKKAGVEMAIKSLVSVVGIGFMLAAASSVGYAHHLGDPVKGHSQLLKTGQGAAAGQEASGAGAAGAGGGITAGTIAASVAVAAAVAVAIAALSSSETTSTTTTTSTATTTN